MTIQFTHIILILLSFQVQSESNNPFQLKAYQAKYQVIRDGDEIAVQRSKLEAISANHFKLNDHTEGTHGLASFTGFERTENSEFKTPASTLWQVQQHQMKQQVTFSTRKYSFNFQPQNNQFVGKHKKKPFTLTSDEHPIAANMLPLKIGQLACHAKQHSFAVPILKSKRISHYQFNSETQSNGLIKASRIYPKDSDKSSHIWLDPDRNCVAIKTAYWDGDHMMETRLVSFNGEIAQQK